MAIANKKIPFNKAPTTSARLRPKVRVRLAGFIAIYPTANANKTPPTAEKVWKESESTAIEPVNTCKNTCYLKCSNIFYR
jgi:hypothetical protein